MGILAQGLSEFLREDKLAGVNAGDQWHGFEGVITAAMRKEEFG